MAGDVKKAVYILLAIGLLGMRKSEHVTNEESASIYKCLLNDGTNHSSVEQFIDNLVKGCLELVTEMAEKNGDHKEFCKQFGKGLKFGVHEDSPLVPRGPIARATRHPGLGRR